MLKYGLCLIALLTLSSLSFADTISITSAPIFEGKYRCKGMDPYINKTYAGTVTVTHKKAVYQLEMDYDTGEKSIGTGGQYDPTLMSVVFQDRNNLKNIGLEQYTLLPDKKTMQGYWVYLRGEKLGSEICERVDSMK